MNGMKSCKALRRGAEQAASVVCGHILLHAVKEGNAERGEKQAQATGECCVHRVVPPVWAGQGWTESRAGGMRKLEVSNRVVTACNCTVTG